MLWKCCIQYASKLGKLSSGHRTGKGQFSFQSQREAMPKKCSNYCTIALISHASMIMLKILQVGLQQYVNWDLPDVQARFRKGKGTRDQTASIHWIIRSKGIPEKHLLLLYWLIKTSGCVDHNKLWKILKEMGIPDHLTCFLRNLYAGQEATLRTRHETVNRFKTRKGVCILSPCLFNFYAEYIMRNARLDEAKAGIKISRRNINNLRYSDDTNLREENEEELKSS